MMRILKEAQAAYSTLPSEYHNFIGREIVRLRDPAQRSVEWSFRGPSTDPSIFDELNISGKKTPFLFSVRELVKAAYDAASSRRVAVAGIGTSVTIANCESDFLFLDSSGQVWAFWHESMSVAKVASNFRTWLEDAKRALQPTSTASQIEVVGIFGRWVPDRSPDLSGSVLEKMPEIEVREDGIWRSYRISGVRDYFWSISSMDPLEILLETPKGMMTYQVNEASGETLVLTGPNSDNRVVYKKRDQKV